MAASEDKPYPRTISHRCSNCRHWRRGWISPHRCRHPRRKVFASICTSPYDWCHLWDGPEAGTSDYARDET